MAEFSLESRVFPACDVVLGPIGPGKASYFVLHNIVQEFRPDGEPGSIEKVFVARNPQKYPVLVAVNSSFGVMVSNGQTKSMFIAPMKQLLDRPEMLADLLWYVISQFQMKG